LSAATSAALGAAGSAAIGTFTTSTWVASEGGAAGALGTGAAPPQAATMDNKNVWARSWFIPGF
jgi:hypothetical protein